MIFQGDTPLWCWEPNSNPLVPNTFALVTTKAIVKTIQWSVSPLLPPVGCTTGGFSLNEHWAEFCSFSWSLGSPGGSFFSF